MVWSKPKLLVKQNTMNINEFNSFLNLFRLGFLRVARLRGGGGGGEGRKVPTAYNSKTINDNEMKFVGVVEDH